jgi:hypothetical protein
MVRVVPLEAILALIGQRAPKPQAHGARLDRQGKIGVYSDPLLPCPASLAKVTRDRKQKPLRLAGLAASFVSDSIYSHAAIATISEQALPVDLQSVNPMHISMLFESHQSVI